MRMKMDENHELTPYTTMHIGGKARYFIEAESVDAIREGLEWAKHASLPVFVLGAGSNLLVHDDGFSGVVIHPVFGQTTWQTDDDGTTLVTIDAGATFDEVIAESCARSLGGIEALSGIPGSAGGSLVQNIGAYGQEISEVFVRANAISLQTGGDVELDRAAMDFRYRHTALKSPQSPLIVTSLTLRLKPFDAQEALQRGIERGFKKIVQTPPQTACALRNIILETRRTKRMCYDLDDVNTHGVGSFFVNPVVSPLEAARLEAESLRRTGRPLPQYPAPNGVKLSAAWLIEQSGLSKGYGFRGAALSHYHCLAIVNRKNATARDVVAFAQFIIETVRREFRVTLSPEVVYLCPEGIAPIPLKP